MIEKHEVVDGASIQSVQAALLDAGAVPVLIAPRLGTVLAADGVELEANGSLENSAPVLFDALVLPDGEDGVALLARHGQTLEFITNQYRHCKTLLVLGASNAMLDKAGISDLLPSGEADPGLVFCGADDVDDGVATFIAALGKHRHPEREIDPPVV